MRKALVVCFAALAFVSCDPVQTIDTVPTTPVATVPATTPPPARVYGVLIADPSHLETDKAAGVTLATRSEHWNEWTPTKAAAEKAIVDRYRAAGFRVAVNLGLHKAPADVVHLKDTLGHQGPQADLTWSSANRTRAAAYIADVIAVLQPDVVVVGNSTTGEITFPDNKTATWTTPGAPAPSDPSWPAWYLGQLEQTDDWLVGAVRATGFAGTIELQVPGGTHTPAEGADFPNLLPRLVAPDVVFVATSLGHEGCAAVAAIVHPLGVPLWGENSGNNVAADMPAIGDQINGCGIDVFSWAFDYQLYDGTHASVTDFASFIAANP